MIARLRPSSSMMRLWTLFAFLCLIAVIAHLPSVASAEEKVKEEDDNDEDYTLITYGSAIKLQHKGSGYRLHSHNIKYGSGSGQQSVTGFEGKDDANSLWQILEAYGSRAQIPGTVVQCGDSIRLQHAQTKRFLHSHLHASPLTHRQEVSGYGDDNGMQSDTGDSWRVECAKGEKEWQRDALVSLVHVDTGKRLYTRRSDGFDNNNCRGCPIVGQLEISCHTTGVQDANALWQAQEGIFFPRAA